MNKNKNYSEDTRNLFFEEDNRKKMKELEEKYGMEFMETADDAEPEIINQFLNNVKAFEEAWETAESKKVMELLGYPEFRKLETLPPGELESEIASVIDKYAEHDINISVLEKDDVPDEVFYKFLTEELPEHETEFIPIEGMTLNFIYEEFHPNDKLDAKDTIEWFFSAYFNNDHERLNSFLSADNSKINGRIVSHDELKEELNKYIFYSAKDSEYEILFKGFELSGQAACKADVDLIIIQEPDENGKYKQMPVILNILFELERSRYGGFDIKSLSIR